ncbi:hypothetical protein JCM8547_006271 [Rhodosporidiobolus lusitaniae]
MASPAPTYVPYQPKRHTTSSSVSSLSQLGSASSPPPSVSRGTSSFIRPSSAQANTSDSLKAPAPTRPGLPLTWSGTSGTSAASSSNPPPSSPPPASSNRPTPPPAGAFPFSTVPPGQSPFDSPRARSPEKPFGTAGPVAALQGGGGGAGFGRPLSPGSARGKMPYRPGFQPQGVKIDRSEEFFKQRKGKSEARKLDEARLSRRLDKLVALHFTKPEPAPPPQKESTLATLSSFSDSIRSRTAKELWRSVAGNVDVEVERAEQGIVKWQDDKDATRCPICTASFGVRARRHHCRLCGRVVCFLPPTPLSAYPEPSFLSHLSSTASESPASPPPPPPPASFRRERCSTFITYEHQVFPSPSAVDGEKRTYGVVVEIPPVEQDLSVDGMLGSVAVGGQSREKEKKDERKKVRVCRDCLNTVMRQQMKTLPVRTPTWLKLYEVLVQLEKEIDETLPEFQELAVTLQHPHKALASAAPPSASHAKHLRQKLLTNLASYDTISKRIQNLPLPPDAPLGGSQDRLQKALAGRGQMYLQEKLGLLRSLGNVEELGGAGKGKKKEGAKEKEGEEGKKENAVKSLASLLGKEEMGKVKEKVGPELEATAQLQVLLEQEALVKSYVEDANSKRQFEDAFALQASLDELRAEIARINATLP